MTSQYNSDIIVVAPTPQTDSPGGQVIGRFISARNRWELFLYWLQLRQ